MNQYTFYCRVSGIPCLTLGDPDLSALDKAHGSRERTLEVLNLMAGNYRSPLFIDTSPQVLVRLRDNFPTETTSFLLYKLTEQFDSSIPSRERMKLKNRALESLSSVSSHGLKQFNDFMFEFFSIFKPTSSVPLIREYPTEELLLNEVILNPTQFLIHLRSILETKMKKKIEQEKKEEKREEKPITRETVKRASSGLVNFKEAKKEDSLVFDFVIPGIGIDDEIRTPGRKPLTEKQKKERTERGIYNILSLTEKMKRKNQ